MMQNIVDRAKGFIADPEKSFRESGTDDLGEALTYFAVLLAVNAVLGGLVAMVFSSVTAGIIEIIGGFIMKFIGLFVAILFVHIFVVILIGGKGIEQTLKVLIYGATPALLLGWIPVISILGDLWSLALWILGVRELHETTTGMAAAAVFIPVVILFVAVTIALMAFVAFFTLNSGTAF